MKKKLHRNDWRRANRLTKIQAIQVTSIRRFEHYYRSKKKEAGKMVDGAQRLKRLRESGMIGYSKPWMQGHYQQAWNRYNHTPRADRTT